MSDLEKRVKHYNNATDLRALHLTITRPHTDDSSSTKLVVHGLLRVHWGVTRPIRLRSEDDSSNLARWRHSCHCVNKDALQRQLSGLSQNGDDVFKTRRSSMSDIMASRTSDYKHRTTPLSSITDGQLGGTTPRSSVSHGNVGHKSDTLRRNKRTSVYNGHTYRTESNTFVPQRGSVTSVSVSSDNSADEVLQYLLNKFQILNRRDEFCLCIKKKSGETRLLTSADYPLLERLRYGPSEEDTNLYVMDRDTSVNISEEVAMFMNLPDSMLAGLLKKVEDEEKQRVEEIRQKYEKYKATARKAIEKKQSSEC